MPMLECPGLFTMPLVPDGWTATSQGNLYELQPASREAALHIAVHERTNSLTPQPGEAEALLKQFVYRKPPEGRVRFVALPQKGHEQRAFAKYVNRADDGKLYEWFAGCILWPTAMLMCSCNATPGHPALKEGEMMIASIFEGTESDT